MMRKSLTSGNSNKTHTRYSLQNTSREYVGYLERRRGGEGRRA